MTRDEIQKVADNWNNLNPDERTRIAFGACFQKAKLDFKASCNEAIRKRLAKALSNSTGATTTST